MRNDNDINSKVDICIKKSIMNEKDKTKEELIKELQELQQEHNSLKASYNKDITESKQAAEAQKRYNTIFEQSPIAIEFYDSDCRLINANSACINLFGVVNINEISGFKMFEDPNIPDDIKAKLLNRESVRFESEFNFDEVKRLNLYQTTCSGIKILDWSISPLINGIGYIEQIQDITDRRRAEEEKQALEERLSRAEKMEALGLLAGGVAHDLNNVLGIVVGYAEMLLSEVDEESPLREDVVTIIEGGQRAAAIVEDMLTIARRGVSGRKVLNLNKLVGDFKKSPDWEKLLSYHPNVQISTDLEPDLLNISGSSIHLVKTLYNLVSNASESMPKGGTITIKTTNQYIDKPISGYDTIREGDYVVFSVSDEGEGISETDIKRIFEPFYTKKIMGRSGTGLGLSVVWGTVKDHQGYIDVRSEEGKGTTFTLYFQVTREDITVDDIGVSLSEYLGNGESILVVDDVKKQRDLAARMLKSLNYNVSSAASGEDTVEYLKEHKVDLLVLDMIMDPGMDGLDTYKSVLKINPKQKAIIVSGFSESDRVNAAHDLGAGAYVKKPYVIEKLGMAVKKELGEKR